MLRHIPACAVCCTLALAFFSCSTTKPGSGNGPAAAKTAAVQPLPEPKREAPKPPYRPSATQLHDLLHTRLEVSFDWQKQHLLGNATLTLKPYFYPQQELVLDAKGFDIHAVMLVKPKEAALKYTYDNRSLRITLDRTYTRTEQFTIEIAYTAKPNELAQLAKENNAISADKGMYFINPLGTEPGKPRQIWTQGETHGSSAWFPTIDQPNERMTQDLYITVEKNFTTLSNGSLVYSRENANRTRTDYWKQDKPHAPYLTMMAIGEFAVVKDKWRNLAVDYYVEPEYRKTAKQIFGNTPEMMEFFSKKLGVDYPWDKYAQVVVRDYVSGAMENTSASTFMEALQLDSRELLDTNWDGIIAHELFHQWFGDLVTCESWANLALNESFANYSELLWAEHKEGPDAGAYQQQYALDQYLFEATQKQVPIIRYHHNQPDDMFDSHSYAKGGRVLHMLRGLLGEEAFFASLNLYLTRHKFTSVEIDELRMAFEDTTGQDLKWFFDQWFLAPGHPELSVAHKYQAGQLEIRIRQEQDTTQSPVYRLPLEVAWWSGGKKQSQQVTLTKASQVFRFPAAAQPELVMADPEQRLLAEINHPKTREELVYQLRHGGHFAAKSQAISKLSKETSNAAVREALLATMTDKFHRLRSQAAYTFTGYAGEQKEVVAAALKKMALTDPKSSVRVTAIGALQGLPGDFKDVYMAGLKDSSYQVLAASVAALGSQAGPEATRLVEAQEKSTNRSVVTAVAAYYAEAKVPGKQPWFEKMLKNTRLNQYTLLQDYGKYLMTQDAQTQQKAIPAISAIARTDSRFYIRMSAFQALTMLNSTPELKALLKEIKEGEKDPRLQKAYEIME